MSKNKYCNKGFTLIELLISMALLSIIMVMVVQFMSSTTAANRKTKSNMKTQSEAQKVMQNISDSLVQADYVRVVKGAGNAYEVNTSTQMDALSRESTSTSIQFTTDKKGSLDFDLVPDDYGNYCKPIGETEERKVIVNMDTYQLAGKKSDTVYPLDGDIDSKEDVRSFRVLKQNDKYYYIKPLYIYAEYKTKGGKIDNVIYQFRYKSGASTDSYEIYMYRSPSSIEPSTTGRFETAKAAVQALTAEEGCLTNNMQDFYLSADAEGNAFLLNAVFHVDGYRYNAVETVKFRNSNVLTVRPQNLYKVKGTGGKNGTEIPDASPEGPGSNEEG